MADELELIGGPWNGRKISSVIWEECRTVPLIISRRKDGKLLTGLAVYEIDHKEGKAFWLENRWQKFKSNTE